MDVYPRLADAVDGSVRGGQDMFWRQPDGAPIDLTGATITGTLQDMVSAVDRAIAGTLSVIDGPAGHAQWDYAAADVVEGFYYAQFNAAYLAGGTPEKSFIAIWRVQPSLPNAQLTLT